MSTIPGLGGHDAAALQRALMDAAERATADEAELMASTGGTGGTGRSAESGAAVRRGASQAQQAAQPRTPAEAIIVEIGKQAEAEVALEGKWLTTPKPGAETPTPTAPQQAATPAGTERSGRPAVADARPGDPQPADPQPGQPATVRPGGTPTLPRGAPTLPGGAPTLPGGAPTLPGPLPKETEAVPGQTRPTPATSGASTPAEPDPATPSGRPLTTGADVSDVRELPLDQLVSVLKGSGTSFKQAVRILAAIQLQQPLPAKATLRAMWDETEAAPRPGSTPQAARAQAAPEVMSAPLDQLVRDRSWHRANAAQDQPTLASSGQEPASTGRAESPRPAVPTLTTVVADQPTNQVYVAGLTTAEYQRLVVMLGKNVPDWFGAVRGARGLRGLMERRGYARLNTTRVAGMRLGAWALGLSGMGILWTAGARWDMWW